MAENWQSSFRKRHKTVFTKAHEVKDLSPENVRVYVLIERVDEGTLYHWNSEMSQGGDAAWPPDINGLVPGKLKSMSPGEMDNEEERRARRSSKRVETSTPMASGAVPPLDDGLLDEETLANFLDDASPKLSGHMPELMPAAEASGPAAEVESSWFVAEPSFEDLFGGMLQSEAYEEHNPAQREVSMTRVDMACLELSEDCDDVALTSSAGSKRHASSPLATHHASFESPSEAARGRSRKPTNLPLYSRPTSHKRMKSNSYLSGGIPDRRIPKLRFPPLSPQ